MLQSIAVNATLSSSIPAPFSMNDQLLGHEKELSQAYTERHCEQGLHAGLPDHC